MLETPVLFLVFNRPDLTEQVLAAIREAKPKKLFVAADGPRADKPGEKEKCDQVRNVILNGVDWDCELETLFRNENLGCGKAPSDAITWFFNHVEQGIILEDDCLPALSFFNFCDEMLTKYKYDERVFAISGTNLLNTHNVEDSYFFSVLGGNWGWASWSRAWRKFDFTMKNWNVKSNKDIIRDFISNDDIYLYYSRLFDEYIKEPIDDVWDYQWFFTRIANRGLTIVPSYNQIKNIGFGADATHTFDSNNFVANLNKTELDFPIKYVSEIVLEKSYDKVLFDKHIKPAPKPSIITRVIRRVKRYLNFK